MPKISNRKLACLRNLQNKQSLADNVQVQFEKNDHDGKLFFKSQIETAHSPLSQNSTNDKVVEDVVNDITRSTSSALPKEKFQNTVPLLIESDTDDVAILKVTTRTEPYTFQPLEDLQQSSICRKMSTLSGVHCKVKSLVNYTGQHLPLSSNLVISI
jgi:hypothetical protein